MLPYNYNRGPRVQMYGDLSRTVNPRPMYMPWHPLAHTTSAYTRVEVPRNGAVAIKPGDLMTLRLHPRRGLAQRRGREQAGQLHI